MVAGQRATARAVWHGYHANGHPESSVRGAARLMRSHLWQNAYARLFGSNSYFRRATLAADTDLVCFLLFVHFVSAAASESSRGWYRMMGLILRTSSPRAFSENPKPQATFRLRRRQ